MLGDIDYNKPTCYEKLELILCKPNGEEIAILSEAYDITILSYFDDVDEISFKIPYYIDQHYTQIENNHWSLIKGDYLIKVNNEKIFYIDEVNEESGEGLVKSVHGFSLEHQLSRRMLRLFRGTRQLYSEDVDGLVTTIKYSMDNVNWTIYTDPFTIENNKIIYIRTENINGKIINEYSYKIGQMPKPETPGIVVETTEIDNDRVLVVLKIVAETGAGILNILEEQTSWKVGYIDPDVREDTSLGQRHRKYRTFDITEKSWLSVIKEDIQKAFDCIVKFDTINKIINIYHIDNIGENKGLFISEENYIKTIKQQIKHENIITRLNVYGKDNLNIASVNPTGQLYIEDYSYYRNLDYMPQDLLDAFNAYDELLERYTPVFYNYLSELDELRRIDVIKQNELVDLWMEWQIAQDNIDMAIQNARPDEDDIDIRPVDLTELNNIRDNIEARIKAKEAEIEANERLIEKKLQEIENLKQILDKKNNFTDEQLKIIDGLTFESTWSNTNYTDPFELLAAGRAALKKLNEPTIEFEIDVVDFLNIVECQHDWDKLVLGDFINVEYKKLNINVEVRLVGIEHNIDNNKLTLKFSNKNEKDDADRFLSNLLSNVTQTSTMVDIFKHQWDLSISNQDLVSRIMNNALNTAKNRVLSGRNQNIAIDERGIHLKDLDSDREQLRMLNNVIAFTKDNWKTVSLAICPDGVVAENLFGKVVASNKLMITNINDAGESTFLVDKNRMSAVNMDLSLENLSKTNQIYMNPEVGILINRKVDGVYKPTLWLDADGVINAEAFKVINKDTVLDDNGLVIDNGKIIINNNYGDSVFYADENGNLTLLGRFKVMSDDGTKVMLDAYKDAYGGKIVINDFNQSLNVYIGSETGDPLYTGGNIQLFEAGSTYPKLLMSARSFTHPTEVGGIINFRTPDDQHVFSIRASEGGYFAAVSELAEGGGNANSFDRHYIRINTEWGDDSTGFVDMGMKHPPTGTERRIHLSGTGIYLTYDFNDWEGTGGRQHGRIHIRENSVELYSSLNKNIKIDNTNGIVFQYGSKRCIINDSEIKLIFNSNNFISITSSGIDIRSSGTITINGSQINLN